MTIRRFLPGDEDEVLGLWESSGLVVPQNDPRVDILKKTNFQPELFFVSVCEGLITGTVMAGYEGHRGWLNYLAVASDSRRQGIGTSLVRHAMDALRKIGCQKVNLQIRKSNSGVVDFYNALGFKEDDVLSMGFRFPQDQN